LKQQLVCKALYIDVGGGCSEGCNPSTILVLGKHFKCGKKICIEIVSFFKKIIYKINYFLLLMG